jgi:hypothetical protein
VREDARGHALGAVRVVRLNRYDVWHPQR